MKRKPAVVSNVVLVAIAVGMALVSVRLAAQGPGQSKTIQLKAPAGVLPAVEHVAIDGYDAAVLPTGRIVTPVGIEVSVQAPKPYGMALSPDGKTAITINSGAAPFSVTLIRNADTPNPIATLVKLNATFMGVAFSQDGSRFYAAGGEDGLIWVGNTATGDIIAVVNLNGITHPLGSPINPLQTPPGRFRGTFPGNLVLSTDGKKLYVVDQGSFNMFVVDTTKIDPVNHGLTSPDPNNFQAVLGAVKVGRYPYGIAASPDGKSLLVSNVGVFQFTHLRPANPTNDNNKDYPLGYPAVGYPEETETSKTIMIKKVDPRNLPASQRDPQGIRVGYIDQDRQYTVPGLGSPNAPQSSSVYVLNINKSPALPSLRKTVKTGPLVGEIESGIKTFGGSHPNAVAVGPNAIYVSNGNNDSISIVDPVTFAELSRVNLAVLDGMDARLKGVQPVALALSPDKQTLYVAEAGVNAIAVLKLSGKTATVAGHIPTAWWPSALQVSPDGTKLYVSNARGRGATPNPVGEALSPKYSTIGTVNIIPVPNGAQLTTLTQRVLQNNGFVAGAIPPNSNPIPNQFGVASQQIKHIIFLNKENSTHDQMYGDIIATRKGVPVNGEPTYSLGYAASPNHHELALSFALGDNFYLEPSVSSDGHRWLTNSYTTEMEDTHWPASYGGRRRDAGADPNIFLPYPGRLGFTDANGSPDPNDYNQHGSIFVHLARYGKSFVNFGNGFEFAQVHEDADTEPTGIRQTVNIPMEKVVRDNSDHMFPEYNTHIPDAPLPEDPTRFSRFGRFKQVFEDQYVDRQNGTCKLPAYVDLFYPNDHGGGPRDINPNGPDWSYTRFVQDNDAALGLTVELISKSPCWKDTVIFVVEDDTQNGLDHVNGARSIFMAISPWIKRESVAKTHYSLSSIFKTVNLILGIPALNQYDAAATDLRDMFTSTPDFTPYNFTPIQYAKGASPEWLAMTKDIDFSSPDRDELKLRAAILKSEGLPRKPKVK